MTTPLKNIVIIRYGHRDVRDYRVTGHCALVARAFGAKKMIVCSEPDQSLLTTVAGVNATWGSTFSVEFTDSWRTAFSTLKKQGYTIVHLTMYGTLIQDAEKDLGLKNKIALVIGSQKVEREVYNEADFNVSVTSQPHSEIAALAVCMDRLQNGKELNLSFKGGKCKIDPQARGKKVINTQTKTKKTA